MPYPSSTTFPGPSTFPGLSTPGGNAIGDERPPLALAVEITSANGATARWGAGASDPGDVAQHIRFATRLGDGDADASVTLARRIDRDYVDFGLLDDFRLISDDGDVIYGGRIASNPRSISDSHSMDITAAGHMTRTRDRKWQFLFVNRDMSTWGTMSTALRGLALAGGGKVVDPAFSSPNLSQSFDGTWGVNQYNYATYDAGPLEIGSIFYAFTPNNIDYAGDIAWSWSVLTAGPDDVTVIDAVDVTGAATWNTLTASAGARFAEVALSYQDVHPTDDGTHTLYWTCLAVYGRHGLSKQGSSDATTAPGFYASDMIRYVIQQACPELDVSGISPTTYVVQQAAYLDPIDPFDVITDLNKFHRYNFGCADRAFYWQPVDMDDYDWQVDYFEPGVTVALQGDSTDGGVFNGAAVNFTNLATGSPARITPDSDYTQFAGLTADDITSLTDSNPDNPATTHDYPRWTEVDLSYPAMPADAVQIAKATLAERNSPRGQGTITVRGYIRDRAGHWRQGFRPRAGERIIVTSSTSLSDRPRQISETDWDQDSKTLTITIEDTPQRVDAWMDRMNNALVAANLVS